MLTVVIMMGLGGVAGSRVCHDVTVANISVSHHRGALLLSLDTEGVSFSSFCGDEVSVLVDGVEASIVSGDLMSEEMIVEANVCYEHTLQINVLEHTLPTKSTKSGFIRYIPKGKCSTLLEDQQSLGE